MPALMYYIIGVRGQLYYATELREMVTSSQQMFRVLICWTVHKF